MSSHNDPWEQIEKGNVYINKWEENENSQAVAFKITKWSAKMIKWKATVIAKGPFRMSGIVRTVVDCLPVKKDGHWHPDHFAFQCSQYLFRKWEMFRSQGTK